MSATPWLKRILDHHHIAYEERQHLPVHGAAQLAHAEHVSGHRVAKTVVLADGGRPVAVVLPASRRLDLERVKDVLGNPDLRLASEEEIAGWFKGCDPGAVPPVRLRGDECILMDRGLAHLGTILFPAGTSEDAVLVRFRDWFRAVRPGVGRFARAHNGHTQRGVPTVLVVEDETATNQLLCSLLEREGYACRGAEAGRPALTLAAAVRPSAILLDLMLPDMSGFELYEELGRSGPLKRIPVIVVTALDDAETRRRGAQLGAEAFLTKPFRPDVLVAELKGLMADTLA